MKLILQWDDIEALVRKEFDIQTEDGGEVQPWDVAHDGTRRSLVGRLEVEVSGISLPGRAAQQPGLLRPPNTNGDMLPNPAPPARKPYRTYEDPHRYGLGGDERVGRVAPVALSPAALSTPSVDVSTMTDAEYAEWEMRMNGMAVEAAVKEKEKQAEEAAKKYHPY